MGTEYSETEQFRDARIHLSDVSGLEIRDCVVTGLKVVDCYGGSVSLGGEFERVVVNDVDVTGYVQAELDRLHPARRLAREAASPAGRCCLVIGEFYQRSPWRRSASRTRLRSNNPSSRRVGDRPGSGG